MPTADPRFTRTERIRLEIPRPSAEGTLSARLLGRDGQPLNIGITLTEPTDPAKPRMVIADLTLAPLAQGEYVIEVTAEQGGKKESATYGFGWCLSEVVHSSKFQVQSSKLRRCSRSPWPSNFEL